MNNIPPIPPNLLEALEEMYPERCPEPSWSDREIWIRVGERRVVRNLRRLFEEQNENILRTTHVLDQTAQDT